MGRYLGGKCRLCRREGMKLFLKGVRCNTEKCSFAKRPTPPGMHSGRGFSKPTYYSLQLREKQKVKRIYGIMEKQFSNYFEKASKTKGVTGQLLLQLLERRLDNVIFRACFAASRKDARQIVSHGHVIVNGRKVDIPSYSVKVKDEVEIVKKDKIVKAVKLNYEDSKDRGIPSWLAVDDKTLKMGILRLPERDDIQLQIQEQLIVELYSK